MTYCINRNAILYEYSFMLVKDRHERLTLKIVTVCSGFKLKWGRTLLKMFDTDSEVKNNSIGSLQ